MKRLVALLTLTFVGIVAPPASASGTLVEGSCRLTAEGTVILRGWAEQYTTTDAEWRLRVRDVELPGEWFRMVGYRFTTEISSEDWLTSRFRSDPLETMGVAYRLDLTLEKSGRRDVYERVARYNDEHPYRGCS